jgi:purine-nucleoside phosphorylase
MSTASQAAALLYERGLERPVDLALMLGTGLGGIADGLHDPLVIPYEDLPGFPQSTVSGHAGRLVIGTHAGKHIACLQGRAHYYETGDAAAMAVPIETMGLIGAKHLLLTCAAGSVNAEIPPGALACVTDHINFSGRNPLIGLATEDRFVNLNAAYDPELATALEKAAAALNIALYPGVYMWFSGPSFETPAEIKMARLLGADLIGMSIVPEVILARRLGLHVAAIAAVTNFGAGFSGGDPTHAETKEVAAEAGAALKRLILYFIESRIEF